MKRNSIRVVRNSYANKISYYFKNELGEWEVLSGSSPLSRQYYTNTCISARAKDILSKIDEIYNRKNKGIDILFEGTTEDYNILNDTVHASFEGRDIICKLGTTKIAVVGKEAVGKSCLIEGMELLQGYGYKIENTDNYDKYTDERNHTEWYEVKGINIVEGAVEGAFETIKELSKEGLSAVIYCISATNGGKIDSLEENLIGKISNVFPDLKVMVVLTQCYRPDEEVQKVIDEVKKVTNQIKLVKVLAKNFETTVRGGKIAVVPSFGLEDVAQYVLEGR